MKKIILTSVFVFIGIIMLAQEALAANAVLAITPSISTSTINTPFNLSVNINPTNNKVCVVKGTINFNNLSCQSITLASGLMAQTMPTCAAPTFTLGIPKCTTSPQDLFSVSVRGNKIGTSTSSLSGVKVIGVGSDVVFITSAGSYNIVDSNSTTGSSHRIIYATTTVQTPLVVYNKPIKIVKTEIATTSATSTATTTEKEPRSLIYGLTASVLEAFNSAIEFIVNNKISVMFLFIVLLTISNIYLWVRLMRKSENI